MNKKLNIFLTIDLECRRNSTDYKGAIYGKLSGQDEAYGLDFILDTFSPYGLKATFFVEPFFSYKFGIDVLKNICEQIISKGHDIQLHLHPYFKSTEAKTFHDDMHAYSLEEQIALIEEGKDILKQCGVKKVSAVRAGAFAANNTIYDAMAECGLTVSSNYNLDYLSKCCKIDLPGEHNDAFQINKDILELPVTCFKEWNPKTLRKSYRHMQITAVSSSEMKYFINHAKQWGYKNIVILFHTFEFIKFTNEKHNKGRFIRTNINRFSELCKFLSDKRESLETTMVSNIKRQNISANGMGAPEMPLGLTAQGKIEQFKKRILL